jgi:hypothetical protein
MTLKEYTNEVLAHLEQDKVFTSMVAVVTPEDAAEVIVTMNVLFYAVGNSPESCAKYLASGLKTAVLDLMKVEGKPN